jgi:hypothetical protein
VTIGLLPARNDITLTVGDDFSLAVTTTEDDVAYSFTGATVTTAILTTAGAAAAVTQFTTDTTSNVLTLTLTDTQTATLGVGTFTYYVSVTKASLTRTWMSGILSVRGPADGLVGTGRGSATLDLSSISVALELSAQASLDGLDTRYVRGSASDAITIGDVPVLAWDAEGNVWGGSDEGLDFDDGGQMFNRANIAWKPHQAGQNPGRLYFNGGWAMIVFDEVPEAVFRRSSGKFNTNERAIANLAVAIPDVTALSGSTITVDDLGTGDAWPTGSARGLLLQQASKQARVTYTGINLGANQLTGVTYVADSAVGSTAYTAGSDAYVYRYIGAGAGMGFIFPESDTGRGGFQAPSARISFESAEDHYPDGYGGYHLGGNLNFGTASPGPRSQIIQKESIGPDGVHLVEGSHAETFATGLDGRRYVIAQMGTIIEHASDTSVIPTPASTSFWLQVEDPSGFAAAGAIEVSTSAGVAVIDYTSIGVGDGVTVAAHGDTSSAGKWYFKGCTTTTPTYDGATIDDQTAVKRAQKDLGVGLGVRANISAHDITGAYQTIIGRIGPTTVVPEGGIAVGPGAAGPVILYRADANVWSMGAGDKMRGHSATGSDIMFESQLTADTVRRFGVRANGALGWGSGSATPDVLVKRNGVGELVVRDETDAADANMRAARFRASSTVELVDAANIVVGSSTGTKIGTSTAQKIGFYNSTPVAKQTGVAVTAEAIHAALVTLGLIGS